MSNLPFDTVAILGAIAFLAGFVDSIAGGGGLLSLPSLLIAGVDPLQALATNKLQGTFGTASATFAYAKRGLISWRSATPFALLAGVSGMIGSLCIQFVPRTALEALIPVLLVVIAIYFARSRSIRSEDFPARISPLAFGIAPIAIGFYDGAFGPGAGSFFMMSFIGLLGYGVIKASAHTKLLNFASNIGSLLVYSWFGAVIWPLGLVMAGCALVGAQIGSRLAIRFGGRLIRPLLVVISSALALRLLLDPANPWRRGLSTLF